MTVVVAADSSCSSAEGGRMTLSPLSEEGVAEPGSISSCADHFKGGWLCFSVMVDGQVEGQCH